MLAAELLEEAADALHVDMDDVRAGRRHRPVVRARQAAIFALRHWTDKPHSFAHIGRLYGTDHKTALHHYQAAETFRERDPDFRDLTDTLIEHARDQVRRQRVGRARGVTPLVALTPRKINEAVTRDVYAVFQMAAALLEADLGEMLAKAHRDGPEYEASAAAVWALRRGSDPQLSFPQIGKLLARHHTTILHADNRADEPRELDPHFARATETLLTETRRRLS